jgi:hypothetical protein
MFNKYNIIGLNLDLYIYLILLMLLILIHNYLFYNQLKENYSRRKPLPMLEKKLTTF